MLMLQFIVDDVISATSFTTARHDNIEEDPPMQNAIKYDAKRIKKGRAAAGRVANGTEAASTTEATSTSTARQPPPTKRGRKPKVVPYVKQIRLDKEEKERVTAALSAARTAARAKLRDNSPAEQVSISETSYVRHSVVRHTVDTRNFCLSKSSPLFLLCHSYQDPALPS